jgi:3-phenylpropionate/trans-cinnamate dioxygenase ferredoxin reductase component
VPSDFLDAGPHSVCDPSLFKEKRRVPQPPRIVIAGAGQAGGAAAAFLRQYGWKDEILLIGEEPIPPYHRPPLSKAWLKGEATETSLALRPPHFYEKQSITLRLGTRVTDLDRAARRVSLSDGSTLDYTALILATGAHARPLTIPGHDLPGVLALRNAADAEVLKAALGPGRRLAIIGGGYIGLEVAASARALGAEVTVIEREARVLARVAGPELSEFLAATHAGHGVTIRCAAGVAAILEQNGRAAGLRLEDGTPIAADAVLVGIGAVPNEALARAAGLACEGGIVVDLAARTADPAVFAIGDCTRRPLPLYDRQHRLESVPNAIEQAKQAAAAICGRPAPAPDIPWFWSDQYDLRLQMAGIAFDATQRIRREDTATGGFCIFHLDATDRILAVEAVNAPAEFMAGRQLVAKAAHIAPARLGDAAIDLKTLIAQA